MAKAKKKAAKIKKKTAVRKKPAAKRAIKKSSRPAASGGVQLGVSTALDLRLRALATEMNKSLEDVLIQALTEFADNWEDHLRTVKTLNAGDDRMQLSVPMDDGAR